MGCDIHVCVEAKRHVFGEPRWVNIDDWKLNPYFGGESEPEYKLRACYRDRNYILFEALAGVRGATSEAIEQPRGMPSDASEATKAQCEFWGVDGHSHSYFTLSELKQWRLDNPHRVSPYNEDVHVLDHFISALVQKQADEFYRENPEFDDKTRAVFWFDN